MTKEQFQILDILRRYTYSPVNPNCWIGFRSFSELREMEDLLDIYPSCVKEGWIETMNVCGTVSIRLDKSGNAAMSVFVVKSSYFELKSKFSNNKTVNKSTGKIDD